MSFGAHELRPGMDVFSADGVLLGSVVQIRYHPAELTVSSASGPVGTVQSVTPFTGEILGPMPTAKLGNGGPVRQHANTGYAAIAGHAAAPAGAPMELLVFRTLVNLDWRTLWPRLRWYPVTLIQHVSYERIVLASRARALP